MLFGARFGERGSGRGRGEASHQADGSSIPRERRSQVIGPIGTCCVLEACRGVYIYEMYQRRHHWQLAVVVSEILRSCAVLPC